MPNDDLGFVPSSSNSAVVDDLGFVPEKSDDLGFVASDIWKNPDSKTVQDTLPQPMLPHNYTKQSSNPLLESSILGAADVAGTPQKIMTGKPVLTPDEQQMMAQHPVGSTIGKLLGSIGLTAPLASVPGVGLDTAFGAASALQESGEQADKINDPNFQPTPASLAAQDVIAGGTGAVTGKILGTPGSGEVSPFLAKSLGIDIPSTVATRAGEQAIGAGATQVTGDISSKAAGGEPQNIPQTLGTAALNTAIYGLTTAAVKMPELRDSVVAEGSRIAGKPVDFDEAKSVVQEAGINPENLSPDFVANAYNARRQDFMDNQIKPLMEKYGASEDDVTGVLQDQNINLRQQTAAQWLYKLNKIDPERATTLQPYFDQIAKGADPVDVMMAVDLNDKILAPLMNKITETVTPEQLDKLSEYASPESIKALKENYENIVQTTKTLTDAETATTVSAFQAEAKNPNGDQTGVNGQPVNAPQSNPANAPAGQPSAAAPGNTSQTALNQKNLPGVYFKKGIDSRGATKFIYNSNGEKVGNISTSNMNDEGIDLEMNKQRKGYGTAAIKKVFDDGESVIRGDVGANNFQAQKFWKSIGAKLNPQASGGYKLYLDKQNFYNSINNKLSSESGQASLPGVDTAAEGIKEIIHLVSPTTFVPKPAMDKIMQMKGDRDKVEFQHEVQMRNMELAFDKMPQADQVDFIDNIKTGKKQASPQLQAVADMMRQIEDNFWAEAKKYKPSLSYLDNHYRVLWKVIPGSTANKKGFKGLFRRPLQGSKGFSKQHTLNDMSEGLAKGGVPYSYNPMTMWRMGIMDMQKFITAQRMWKTMKDMGFVKFVKFGQSAPDGFVKLNDNISKIYFPTDAGMVNAGEFYVEENTGRILNNFLGKDWIRDTAIGSSLLKFKNVTTSMELALSPFHASYVSLAAMASSTGLGLQKIANRGLHGDAGAFLDGLKDVALQGAAPGKFVKAGTNMIKYVSEPSFKNSRLYQDFKKEFPNIDDLIDDLFAGGGKLAIHQDYKINSVKAFQEGIKNKEPWAMTISALPAANEMIMKPLFEIYIPRLKVGAFLYEMSNEIVQRQTQLQSGKLTRPELAREVWRSIENRFGEMNFDNLFWDRTFKSALQLVFRSVTWKMGALKNIGQGFGGQIMEIKNAIDENRAPLLDRNTAWLFGIALMVALFSALVQKLFLNEWPKDLKDILAPRYDKQGNRISLNTHLKDWIHLAHSPLSFVTNSLSGAIGKEVDIWNNKDFFNTRIYDKNDPWWQQEFDKMKYRFPTPMSISNQKKLKGDDAPAALKGAVALGIAQPAPGYISQTPAQEEANKIMDDKGEMAFSKEQRAHMDFKSQLTTTLANTGNRAPLNKAMQDGQITYKEYKSIVTKSTQTPLERTASSSMMSYSDVAKVMEKASPAEIKQLLPIFEKKVDNKILANPENSYLTGFRTNVLKKYGIKTD